MSRERNRVCIRCGYLRRVKSLTRPCECCGVVIYVDSKYVSYSLPIDVAGNYVRYTVPQGALLVLRSHPEP